MKYVLVLVLIMIAAPPVAAADLSVEERLTRLEQEVAALRAENDALRKQLGVSSTVQPVAPAAIPAAPAAPDRRVQIGGLIQAQAESGQRPDSRFTNANDRVFLRRARLRAQGQLVPHTDFRVELDLTGNLSATTGMRAQLTDGYMTWTALPWASIRAGQFKTPFGHEQLFSDSRLLTPERGLASDRLTPGRQLGAQIFGDLADGRLSYAFGAFNGNGANTNDNDNERFLTAGRVSGTLWSGGLGDLPARWTAGLNGYASRDRAILTASDFGFDSTPATPERDTIFAGSRRASGADTQLVAGPAEVWVEYLRTSLEPDNAIPAGHFVSSGWSVLGAWTLLPDRLQAVGRVERFDPNDTLSNDATRLWSAGANWLIKGNDLRLQLFYMRGKTAGRDQGRVMARVQTVF